MPLPVSLDEVADELDGQMEEMTVFINRRTGELATISDDDLGLVDKDEEDLEGLPEWQAEMIPHLREMASGVNWIQLPDKHDIHEWQIMSDFADEIDDVELSDRLGRAIRGKGAFRMFRDAVEHAGMREEWFHFKREALRKIARRALEERDIPYQ
jgi:hypothetical protein